MKRIIVLALAACMVLGAAFGASAAEFKASGYLYAGYDYYNVDNDNNRNAFSQRFRSQIDIIASESLSGTVYFEINQTWGSKNDKVGGGSGGQIGADGVNVQTKRAYMTFLVPNTAVKVRAGIQGLALPGAVAGSPIIDDDVAAIVASTSFDNIDVTAFFARPSTSFKTDTDYNKAEGTADLFGAIVAADFDVVTVTPYFMFTNNGYNSDLGFGKAKDANGADVVYGKGKEAQWYGIAVESAPIENLTLTFDGIYGKVDSRDAGFFLAAKAAYATDFAVPAILAWYGSGADNAKGDNLFPVIGGNDFVPTTLVGFGAAANSSDELFGSAVGKWGVSLQASEISFIEKVSHTVRATYIQGTNDDDLAAGANLKNWTTDDKAYEFDFVTTYAMYENLDLIVDLAYVVTDLDDAAPKTDDVFKAAIGAKYNF
ncbi:outer membrane homotrimeric porin [Halodesulfovibrio sp.]|uniref:outer membrane homotrimeric porin n=1 Tax=Halodesulfovibrio sp. TaxID=1912772 RepID=UPI0025C700B2|nr:outer membrane homotrimeric porin [Halodesulfovibrio sp.]